MGLDRFAHISAHAASETNAGAAFFVSFTSAMRERIEAAHAVAIENYENEMDIRQAVIADLYRLSKEIARSYSEAEAAAQGTPLAPAFDNEHGIAFQLYKNTFESIKVIVDKMAGILPTDTDPCDAHVPILACPLPPGKNGPSP